MSAIDDSMRPMLDTFTFETTTLLDQLDEILLEAERDKSLNNDQINEIFRTMHTVKGSAAMMGLTDISEMTHHAEDMFFIIRDDPAKMDDQNTGVVFDLLFQVSDFLRQELGNLQEDPDHYESANPTQLSDALAAEILVLKGEAAPAAPKAAAPLVAPPDAPSATALASGDAHAIRVFFNEDCEMVNVRAFMLVNQLKEYGEVVETVPPTPEANPDALRLIEENGFLVHLKYDGDMVIDKDMDFDAMENIKKIGLTEKDPM